MDIFQKKSCQVSNEKKGPWFVLGSKKGIVLSFVIWIISYPIIGIPIP